MLIKSIITFSLALFLSNASMHKPVVAYRYINNTDKMIYKSLTLSDDGVFFAYTNCECGTERFTKGKWKIEGKYLYLNSLPDSSYSIYPKIETFSSKVSNDSIDIYFTNYFNEPVNASILAYKYKDTAFKPTRLDFDTLGHIKISKKEYSGFMMEYDPYREFQEGEKVGVSFIDSNISMIKIKAAFDFASYDRQLIQENLGKIKYKIVKDNLYTVDGEVAYGLN